MRRRTLNKINLSEKNRKDREKKKKQLEEHRKNMEIIKNSPVTDLIKYPEYKEAFDYVDNLFPGSNVKNIILYKTGAKLLEKLGYGGAGGFYDKETKVIVIASYQITNKNRYQYGYNFSIKASITKDEVIAHELCHYCFAEEGGVSFSREIQEEFAYGWTLGYLRGKGYTDDEIIKNNYFPFMVDVSSDKALKYILSDNNISKKEYNSFSEYKRRMFFKKYGKKWHQKRKELATQKAKELIELYSRKLIEGTNCTKIITKYNRFEIMDI